MARQKKTTHITEQKPFPKRLRGLMIEKNSSQTELAKIVNCTRQAISLYATGQSTPDIDILLKIAQYFNVSTDYLLGLTDVKTPDIDRQAIHEKTGLSEVAIGSIINLKTNETNSLDALNTLLEHGRIWGLLYRIMQFINVVELSKTYNDKALDVLDSSCRSVLQEELDKIREDISKISGIPKELLNNINNIDEYLLFNLHDEFITMMKELTSYDRLY